MQIDSANLFKPALFFMVIRGIFIFLSMTDNPLFIPIGFFYGVTFLSVRKDGLKYKYILPVIIVDIAMNIVQFQFSPLQLVVIYGPLIILFILSIFMINTLQKEYTLFERTVVSFNSTDRILARQALLTLDPEDIAKVAEYTSWQEVL
jgi:hypothetical protein